MSLELEIIAHRGVPRELPENSLPGFARAVELGADGIELDVHLTADGVLVVHHDPVLTGPNKQIDAREPRIDELTWDALTDFPIAYGVPIPRLAEDVWDWSARGRRSTWRSRQRERSRRPCGVF